MDTSKQMINEEVSTGTGSPIMRSGVYYAKLVDINALSKKLKPALFWDSFQWYFVITKGEYEGFGALGLTPKIMKRLKQKSTNEGRLVDFLDILHGTPITDQAIAKYSVNEVPLTTLRTKYIGKTLKIRITRHVYSNLSVDYRATQIIEVV